MFSIDQFSDLEPVRHAQTRHDHTAEDIHYPWSLEKVFPEKMRTFSMIGYGSLINRDSAARSLSPETIDSARPVIAFGARRMYNTVRSRKGFSTYEPLSGIQSNGVLNACRDPEAQHWLNAVEYQLREVDIENILERERGYDLIPAWTVDWEHPHQEPRVAYLFSRRQKFYEGEQLLHDQVIPHTEYHEICEAGCREFSEGFLRAFRSTTWRCNETGRWETFVE